MSEICNRCEFCGREKPSISTEFYGSYCANCLELVMIATNEAITKLENNMAR